MTWLLFDSFPDTPGPPPPAPEEMDSATAAQYMLTAFVDGWTATPYRFDNEMFDPRTAGNVSNDNAAWLDLVIAPVTGRQQTLGRPGNRLFYRRDLLVVTVASRADRGAGPATRLAEQVRDLFEGYRNGGLYVTDVVVRRIGNNGEWYRVVVDVPFNYHEMK